MSKPISKERIVETCIQKQEALIDNFESRVAEAKADAYGQSQSASQTENRTAGKIELLSTMENELAFAQIEMGYLKSLNAVQQRSKVEPGAVVVTNLRTFFVAISSERMEIDGEQIFGLSNRAPLYQVMEGLSSGDTFEYNQTKYEIINVY